MAEELNLSIETVFVELLWQRADDHKIDHLELLNKTVHYQSIKESIIKDLMNRSTIDLVFGDEPISQKLNQVDVQLFVNLLVDEKEENRIIERSIFIANQE